MISMNHPYLQLLDCWIININSDFIVNHAKMITIIKQMECD